MKQKPAVPVLVLSGHTIALGVVRSLGRQGVPVHLVSYDRKDMAPCSKYVRSCRILPHPEKQPEEFVAGLLDIGKKTGRAVVFPADDPTLVTLSKYRAELEATFIVPTPDWTITQKVINKDITYALAEQAGVPVPKTLRLQNSDPLPREQLQAFSFPCLIKPVQSHLHYEVFKRKMTVVNDPGQLEAEFLRCRQHGIDVTVQEIIAGPDCCGLNFNSLFYEGRICQGFAAYKVRMTDEGYGIPAAVRSRQMIPDLWQQSEALLKAVGYEGYSCIEYKYDSRDQRYKLMEINGRYNRSSMLSVKAGINFPWLEYQHLVNGRSVTHQDYRPHVYYIDEFKDFQVNFKKVLAGRLSPAAFFKPYVSKHVFAVFSMRDPKPFLKRAMDGVNLFAGVQKEH